MDTMNNRVLRLLVAAFVVLAFSSCGRVKPPVAAKMPHEIVALGDTRVDPYFWMNERDTPAVIANLNAENAYADAVLKPTEALQEKLFNEMKSRIKEEDVTVPYFDNGYYYYTRYEKEQEYPVYCRKQGSLDSKEEILLNVNTLAKGHSFFNVSDVSVSTNNRIIAYGVDTLSRRRYTIYFKDLTTGELLPTKISNTTGEAVWANDNNTVFYSIKDSSLRPFKILKHKLANLDEAKDVVVFHERDSTFSLTLEKSKTSDFIYIASYSTMATEYQYLSANKPDGAFKMVQPRERGHEYNVTDFGGKFYFVTNLDAINFRLMVAPIATPSKKYWKEVIPHRADVLLEGFDVYKNFYTVQERKRGLTNIRIVDWKTNAEQTIDFGEETYTAYLDYNPDFNATKVRFRYTSLTTPVSVYDYDVVSKTKALLKRQEVLGGEFKPENYEAKRLWAKAQDGVMVPISVVYKKGIKLDGSNPALIYAYGSYGSSMDPYFSATRLSLLDRGFVYAIAHVRGGQELGRQWYEDGKLLKKKNTFTDFIACSEFLVSQGYTSPAKLFAQGGSAGGLLMGAIANMRPDLYKGIIAEVPFVDVVTTMLDESIPLTTGEFDEWGNPKVKEYYDYMKSYSPYDNVEAKDYPNMLVTSGYYDSQVQYFEPQKWVAKLRDIKTDNNILLFKIDMEAGHGGASGRFKPLHEVALNYAFMLYLLDKTN